MKVLKFGGSVLKNKTDVDNLLSIVNADNGRACIVVSAFYGITNQLEQLADYVLCFDLENKNKKNSKMKRSERRALFRKNMEKRKQLVDNIIEFHKNIIDELSITGEKNISQVFELFNDLKKLKG